MPACPMSSIPDADPMVTSPKRDVGAARVGGRRIVAVERRRRRRSVGVEDLPERLVGLEHARTGRRDRLCDARDAAVSRRRRPDQRDERSPRVVVEIVERDAGKAVRNADIGRQSARKCRGIGFDRARGLALAAAPASRWRTSRTAGPPRRRRPQSKSIAWPHVAGL